MLHSILSLDLSVLHALYAHRDPSVLFIFLGVTQLGSVVAIFSIGIPIAIILALRYRMAEMTGLVIALGGAAFASVAIKHLIQRPRPDFFYQSYPETGYSFPSEHTALATAFCIFLVYLIFRLTPSRHLRTIATCLALMVIGGVGFSRLYLGVHYASDVVGGLVLGALMATLGIMVERSFEHVQRYRSR